MDFLIAAHEVTLKILIAESNPSLGELWKNHIDRQGATVELALSQEDALKRLRRQKFDVLLIDLDLASGGALAVADYTNYRWPDTRVIFVTAQNFFSDGSIFNFSSNACAFVPTNTRPDDLAALVEHHARA